MFPRFDGLCQTFQMSSHAALVMENIGIYDMQVIMRQAYSIICTVFVRLGFAVQTFQKIG